MVSCYEHPAPLPVTFCCNCLGWWFCPGSTPWAQYWVFWGADRRAEFREPLYSPWLPVDLEFDSLEQLDLNLLCLLFLSFPWNTVKLQFILFHFLLFQMVTICQGVLHSSEFGMCGHWERRCEPMSRLGHVSCLRGSNLYTESWLHGVGF